MSGAGEEDEPFPAEDGLFSDTFPQETVYTLWGEELRIRQVFGSDLGVAAPVWEAALHLGAFMEARGLELRGRRLIELGAGTGLLGLLAARLGAVVTLTDLPLALAQLRDNVSLNTPSAGWPSAPPRVLPLSWGRDHVNFPSDWDLVLCADIVYLPQTFPLLLDTLTHLCKSGGVAYLSSNMREGHQTHVFYERFLPSRFQVELLQHDDKENLSIYRARLSSDG